MTRADAAAALGVEPNRINKWAADGAPVAVRGARGHAAYYDLDALRAWRESRGRDATTGEAGLSLGAARARLAEAQAQKWERENAVRAGELVAREQAVREGQTVVRALQARLLALPRQAVMRGVIPRENERALRALIVETLRELARWKTVEDAERATAEAEADAAAEAPTVAGPVLEAALS